MESNNIKYLIKSNGTNKCRNQISAWHDEFPKYYDCILIIAYPGFQDKIKYCEEHNIKYKVIGHAGLQGASYDPIWQEVRRYSKRELDIVPSPIQTLFVCPSGRTKQCHEREFDGYNEAKPLTITDDVTWGMTCRDCKAAYDFFLFTSF